MIVFNLLPIFPLDGYRFIEDVCILNKKILIKEIFIYGGILILLFVMISTFEKLIRKLNSVIEHIFNIFEYLKVASK
mgnify:CR=1 FL=1